MSQVAAACLAPALRVLLHELSHRDQLVHYLENPLLLQTVPTRIRETQERLGGYSDKRCMEALIKVKTLRDKYRGLIKVPLNEIELTQHDLANLLETTLVNPDERARHRAYCFGLHPLERPWEYARLKEVLRAREAAAWEQQEQYLAEDE